MSHEVNEAAASVLSIVHRQLQSAIVSPPRVKDTSKQVDWAALVPVLQTAERLIGTFEDLIGIRSRWGLENAGNDVRMEYDNVQYWMTLLRHTLTGVGKLQKISDNPQA